MIHTLRMDKALRLKALQTCIKDNAGNKKRVRELLYSASDAGVGTIDGLSSSSSLNLLCLYQ